MLKKIYRFRNLSLLLSVLSVLFCIYNYNGALSSQFAGNSIAFYGILGLPVVVSIAALVFGVMAWTAVKVLSTENKE